MNQRNDEIPFVVTLESDEGLSVKLIADTLRDIEKMLSDIEKRIFETPDAKAQWKWPDEAELEVVATVNGLSKDQLSRIVEEAEKGFAEAREAKGSLTWPESFGPTAKDCARRILRRLDSLNSIVVRAENHNPITITSAEFGQTVKAKMAKRKSAHSSIEGKLELISHRGKLRAAIKENVTGCTVQCSFPDKMVDDIKDLFDRRVIVEGIVSYRKNGEPISIAKITSIIERKIGEPLRRFIGAAPDLTRGLSSEEFISRIRG